MNGGGSVDQQPHNLGKSSSVALSRSVLVTNDTCIPSLLILGKLLCVASDGGSGSADDIDMVSLEARLLEAWAPSGAVNFWRVTGGAFLIQFHDKADLTRAMDGAPWCCCDGHLFLMHMVKPETNLLDQLQGGAAGFATADLWVQFHLHNVPVEYFSVASFCELAKSVGVLVVFPDLATAPLLRARIRVDLTGPLVRSIPVDLRDDGRCELVSVVYEQIPSLCVSCGIIGHPADRCCPKHPAAASRSRREKPAGYVRRSHPVPSTSLSPPPRERSETQPLPGGTGREDHRPNSSSATAGAAGPPSPTQLQPKPQGDSRPRPDHRRGASVNGCFPCNLLDLISCITKKKQVVGLGDKKVVINNSQDMQRNQKHQTLLLTFSAAQQSVQESLEMEEEETSLDSRFTLRTLSSFQLAGGCVNYYSYSGSRKNPRIKIRVETQCPSHLLRKAMEWLAQNTGLKASYDGKKGIISVVGLQVDQRMGPFDLVAYVYPDAGPNGGVPESPKKPDSPARFENLIMRVHDVNGRGKGVSG